MSKPVRNPDIMWKQLGTEVVTLNRKTNQYFILNAAAALIFKLAEGNENEKAIAGKLTETFGVDPATALQDTRETLAGMEKLGLLTSSKKSVTYVKPIFKEITVEDFNKTISGGAQIACRSLLG